MRKNSTVYILTDPNSVLLGKSGDTFFREGKSLYHIDNETGIIKELFQPIGNFFGKYKLPLYSNWPIEFTYASETWVQKSSVMSKVGWVFLTGKDPLSGPNDLKVEPTPTPTPSATPTLTPTPAPTATPTVTPTPTPTPTAAPPTATPTPTPTGTPTPTPTITPTPFPYPTSCSLICQALDGCDPSFTSLMIAYPISDNGGTITYQFMADSGIYYYVVDGNIHFGGTNFTQNITTGASFQIGLAHYCLNNGGGVGMTNFGTSLYSHYP
jgi:hypothetical protein